MMTFEEVVARYHVAENPLKAERRAELAAVVLLLILCVQIALGLVSIVGTQSVPVILPSDDALTVGKLEQIVQVKADARDEIVSRPLFWEQRSPAMAAEVVAVEPIERESAGQKLKDVKVVGIYGSGTTGGAIVRVKGTKRRVAIGEEVSGWVLDTVSPNSARFVKGASADELVLQRVDASKLVKVVPSAPKQEPTEAQKSAPSIKKPLGLGGIDRG